VTSSISRRQCVKRVVDPHTTPDAPLNLLVQRREVLGGMINE
jgi:hypothetical protein